MKTSKYFKRRTLFAFCVVFCLLTFVIFAASEAGWRFSAAQVNETPSTVPYYRFIAGEESIYKVRYSGTAQTDFRELFDDKNQSANKSQSGPLGLAQSLNTSVQGQLSITVIEVKDGKVLVAYSLHNAAVKLIVNDQDDIADAETIRGDLERNIFGVLNSQGKVLSVRFDTKTGKLSQSFARALIAAIQFVFPDDGSGKLNQWETQEDDPNGQYVARYLPATGDSTADSAGLVTIQKTITRYLPAAANSSPTEFNLE